MQNASIISPEHTSLFALCLTRNKSNRAKLNHQVLSPLDGDASPDFKLYYTGYCVHACMCVCLSVYVEVGGEGKREKERWCGAQACMR